MHSNDISAPRRTRLFTAAMAVAATGSIVAVVLALAGHYDTEFMDGARAQASDASAHAHATTAAPAASGHHS